MVPLGPGPGHPTAHQTHGGPSTNLSGPNSLSQSSSQSNKSSVAVSFLKYCSTLNRFTSIWRLAHVYVTFSLSTCDLALILILVFRSRITLLNLLSRGTQRPYRPLNSVLMENGSRAPVSTSYNR